MAAAGGAAPAALALSPSWGIRQVALRLDPRVGRATGTRATPRPRARLPPLSLGERAPFDATSQHRGQTTVQRDGICERARVLTRRSLDVGPGDGVHELKASTRRRDRGSRHRERRETPCQRKRVNLNSAYVFAADKRSLADGRRPAARDERRPPRNGGELGRDGTERQRRHVAAAEKRVVRSRLGQLGDRADLDDARRNVLPRGSIFHTGCLRHPLVFQLFAPQSRARCAGHASLNSSDRIFSICSRPATPVRKNLAERTVAAD